jgi:hypothetical protein
VAIEALFREIKERDSRQLYLIVGSKKTKSEEFLCSNAILRATSAKMLHNRVSWEQQQKSKQKQRDIIRSPLSLHELEARGTLVVLFAPEKEFSKL